MTTLSSKHSKTKFSNGLTVLFYHSPNDPISACHLFLPGGTSCEPPHQYGISTLMWSLLLKGTTERTARKISEDLESMGASLGAGANHDYHSVSCYAISEHFEKTLRITAEALFKPYYNSNEINKEKTSLIASIQSKKESIFTITNERLNKHLFKNHPYAYPASGNEMDVKKITSDQIKKWHDNVVSPNRAILSIATDIPFKKILRIIDHLFGPNKWKNHDQSWRKYIDFSLPIEKSDRLDNTSKFEQAYLMMGYPSPSAQSSDYPTLKVINGIMGGGMSARLFQNLREKNGLAYEVGSFYPTRKFGSAFTIYMGLQESRLKEAEDLIKKELDRIKNDLIPEEELKLIKNYLIGTYFLDHQTNSQRAHYLGWWESLGLSSYFDPTYTEQIKAVTSNQIRDLSQKIFNQESITVHTAPKSNQKEPATT